MFPTVRQHVLDKSNLPRSFGGGQMSEARQPDRQCNSENANGGVSE